MSATAAPRVGPRVRVRARGPELEQVYVWDLVVRLCHWAIATSIFVLSATGLFIANPFDLAAGSGTLVMAWVKVVHFYTAIVFVIAVVVRVIWMFTGSEHARWWNFIPVHRERRRLGRETFLYYVFLKRSPPRVVGHNPLAGMAYFLIFGLYGLEILTGLVLYSVAAPAGSPLEVFEVLLPWLGGTQLVRWIHHAIMWLLIGFFFHHVYSATLMDIEEGTGVMDAIVSGHKWVERDPDEGAP